MPRTILAFLFLFPILALGSSRPNDVINPVDEENLGYAIVLTPKDPNPARPTILDSQFYLRASGTNQRLVVGQPFRTLDGEYTLDILNSASASSTLSKVKVLKKQTTTIQTAALKVSWDTVNSPLNVQVGPQPIIRVVANQTGFNRSIPYGKNWLQDLPGGISFIPVFADQFTISYADVPLLNPITVNLNAGDVHEEILKPDDVRSFLQIKKADELFQDAVDAETVTRAVYVVHRSKINEAAQFHVPFGLYDNINYSSEGEINLINSVALSKKKDSQIAFFPSADGRKDLDYELVVNNTWMPIKAKRGQTVTVQLKRIDVNDVQVRQEDGTTYMASGTYQVSALVRTASSGTNTWQVLKVPRFTTSSPSAISNFPTKSGLTVVPGLYKIKVDYSTREGRRSFEQELDLR